MQTYSFLREFADSWFLLAMFAFFVGACAFAFWPGLSRDRDSAASIPLRDEPAPDITPCRNACANCVCKHDFLKEADNG